jgi:hypothetical protein
MEDIHDRSNLGRFEITARLYTLIDSMSVEKQFILLKQLLGANLAGHLMRLVLDMTEAERVQLLNDLGESPSEETTVKTIQLDESNNLMRGNLRQKCRIPVRIKTTENTHDCTIVDISTFGVFIKSNTRHAAGKTIHMVFLLPGSKIPLQIDGRIVRSTPEGIGVRFQNLKVKYFDAIKRYCEQN